MNNVILTVFIPNTEPDTVINPKVSARCLFN